MTLATDSGALACGDVAPLLADAGAFVVIADHDTAAAHARAQRICADGNQASAITTDVGSEASVIGLFAQMRERFGCVDILVNYAGLVANQALVETTLEQFDDLQALNLRSEGVRLMLEHGSSGAS